MAAQVEKHINKCHPCLTFKARQPKALLENIVATHPMEFVHLNYLCLEPEKGLEENVLVVTDHLTWYAQAYVTWSQTTQTIAKALWDNFISHYGLPKRILLDQGRNFKSQLVANLCELKGTQKLWTSPYHSWNNSQCERFNSTLIGMLGTLPPERKSDLKNLIGVLVPAYNCTQNSATGFTPYILMYQRQPCFPINVTLGLVPHSVMAPTTSKFVQKLREHVQWAHKKAESFQVKEAWHHKLNYDKHSSAATLEVGDMVLVCVTAFKGHQKIKDQWENREYVVERWPYPNVPVYVACPRDGEGCSWTLQRNYLLPTSPNLEQSGDDMPVAGVEHTGTSAPMPSVDSEPADSEPSGTATSDTTGNTTQGSQDQLAPLRCSTCATQNQLPWRYHNFALSADISPPGNLDVWVGLCIAPPWYHFCTPFSWEV